MPSIAEMTEEINKLISADPEREAGMWQWFSQKHYEQVVRQAGEDHLLVRIKRRFDISEIEQACASFRLYAGQRGVEATHSVRQLCWGVLVKTVMCWSYERTVENLSTDSLLRWFVGYNLNETTFSAVTLWRFEEWQKEHYPRLVFNELLKQIDQDFVEDVQAVQIGDTFALQARAREQSHTELLRSGSRKLLRALEQVTAEGYQQVLVEIELEELFGKPDDSPEWWMKKEQRVALEERTALAAMRTLAVVNKIVGGLPPSSDIVHLALQRWLGVVKKVLNDEFTFEQDQNGVCSKATVRSKHESGCYAIGSTVDPEATFRDHPGKCELGYNGSVAATTHFIREIAAATGATPDSKGVAPLIEMQKEQLGAVPPKFIYDRAAGTGKIYDEVAKASDGKTQLVARLIDHSKSSDRFGPNDFKMREDGGLECPNGVTSYKYYRSGSGEGWNYRFQAKQCQGCPLLDLCRGDKVKDGAYRQVYISNYIVEQRKAIIYLDSDAAKQDLKLRPNIERIIACLVRYNGARRAKGYGLRNADYQLRMAAVAYNLKHWAVLTNEREKSKRSPTPDRS